MSSLLILWFWIRLSLLPIYLSSRADFFFPLFELSEPSKWGSVDISELLFSPFKEIPWRSRVWTQCFSAVIQDQSLVRELRSHRLCGLANIYIYIYAMLCWVAQSCPTLCNPMDSSPPGCSVHGILQAGILEEVAIPFSRASSWPRDQAQVSYIAGRFFTIWATRESPAHRKHKP